VNGAPNCEKQVARNGTRGGGQTDSSEALRSGELLLRMGLLLSNSRLLPSTVVRRAPDIVNIVRSEVLRSSWDDSLTTEGCQTFLPNNATRLHRQYDVSMRAPLSDAAPRKAQISSLLPVLAFPNQTCSRPFYLCTPICRFANSHTPPLYPLFVCP
jgi:hypothetical protein